MSDIGFIGTGIMGLPMAKNLQATGHNLHFSEQYKPVPEELLGTSGNICSTPAQVAEVSEFIILMLPDTSHVETVLFGENGVSDGLGEGKTVIDMSSISPLATKEFAARVREQGAAYLDAPVSGGEVGAKSGTLTIMVGGDQAAFDHALPILQTMGKNINLIGEAGDGQTCKVANQIIVAINLAAVSEALVFASKAGADPAKVREALMGGFATSKILEVHGERMIKGTFDPGFRINLHQKDLNIALDGARDLNVSLPGTAIVQEMFNACSAMDGGEWDHSAIIKAVEKLANHSIRE